MSPFFRLFSLTRYCLAAAFLAQSCSSSFTSTPVETPPVVEVGVKGQIQALEKSFTDGGLSSTEAKALAEAMIVGGGGTTASNETLVTYIKSADMLQAGMAALGSTSFTSDTRKRTAIPLYVPALFSLFSTDLQGISDTDLVTFAGDLISAQVKTSGSPQFNAENHRASFRAMLNAAVKTAAPFVETADARALLWKAMADSTVSELDDLNLFASNMKTVIGNLAGGAYEGTIAVSGLSAGEKSELMIEFTARLYANIEDTGLSVADLIEAATNVDSEITTVLAADTDLSGSPVLSAQVQAASYDGGGCVATTRLVYVWEYSDSRCQTVVKKWIQSAVGGSPFGRGFPTHAFCYRDSASGNYYNWLAVGTAGGCATTEPVSPAVFPNNPSPRNLTTTPAGGFSCQYGASGTETGTNGESREKCEGRALAQFIAAGSNDYTEVWVSGTLVAVLDEPNASITFPSVARACTVTTSPGGVIRQTSYVRTSRECLNSCELIISEDASTAYDCNLAGTLLQSYPANSVTAPTPIAVDNTVALTNVPASFTAGVCTAIGVSLQRTADSAVLAGSDNAVTFEGSAYLVDAITGYGLKIYKDSACTRLATVTRLPSSASEAIFYVKAPADAVTLDLRVFPLFDGAQASSALAVPVVP